MSKKSRLAFAISDLLVVLVLIAVLSALSIGAVEKSRDANNRIACAKNLGRIAQAILLYAQENKGIYPRTRFDADARKWTAYSGWKSSDPFNDDRANQFPAVNDVTAPLFLLVRTQDISTDAFVCPSTNARAWDFAPALEKNRKTPVLTTDRSNFPSPIFLSYSFINPYPDKAAIQAGYQLNLTLGAEIPIAADMNPGGKTLTSLTKDASVQKMREGNSFNHGRVGQCVLYADGHVDFFTTPFVGAKRDNIYTVSGSDDGSKPTSETIVGSPRWKSDSILLPTSEDKGDEDSEKLSPPAPAEKAAEIAAKIAATKEAMSSLRDGLDTFEVDNGAFPTTAQGLAALITQPANLKNWHGPYIDAKALIDGWGNKFNYSLPGKHNAGGFDLWSNGADDVKNWGVE